MSSSMRYDQEEEHLVIRSSNKHRRDKSTERSSQSQSVAQGSQVSASGGGGAAAGAGSGGNESSPDSQGESNGPRFKRLIVCCDGTWLDSDNGMSDGKLVPPSNVTRLTRAIRSTSGDGIPQIVYYQTGVGSTGTLGNKVFGGGLGLGVTENVREAYAFIANNYAIGDEIFLIGFSRGAFTARSVGGLIGAIGILTRKGMEAFPVIYKDYQHQHDRHYQSRYHNIPFADKPSMSDPSYAQELAHLRLTTLGVRIRAVGVFDTVGALGIPRVSWLGQFGQHSPEKENEYSFYDTTLDDCIDNAFQALALDEKRATFQPCLWEKRGNKKTNLIQVWFPGVHANVGGGYDDQELSNITLAWMMSMLSGLLDLRVEYIHDQYNETKYYYEHNGKKPRGWSFGKIYNSVTATFVAAGTIDRTPGHYMRIDPDNGNATNKPLRDTREYIHSCVRSRTELHGPGYADKGTYDSAALQTYRLRCEGQPHDYPTGWYWEDPDTGQVLPEAPLRQIEKVLLALSPRVEDYVFERGQKSSRRPKS